MPRPMTVGDAKAQLHGLIARVMADGRVDDREREVLRGAFAEAVLQPGDVREVLAGYLTCLGAGVLGDGVVTAEERRKVEAVVSELGIPLRMLPPELLDVALGKR